VVAVSGAGDERSLLRWAAAAERPSEHPLARAVVEAARARGVAAPPVEAFAARVGRGVSAVVDGHDVLVGSARWLEDAGIAPGDAGTDGARDAESAVHVAVDGRWAGTLAVADPLKDTAPEGVRALQADGQDVWILTGDGPEAAAAVAARLGIPADHVRAGLLPTDKAAAVRALRDAGHRVAMVGDGINDAPALAAADVGIAMGTGTDIAMAAAGITLMGGDVRGVAAALRLARRAMGKIRQNLVWAFAYNLVLVPAAALAWLVPILAGAAMAASSILVTGNSALLNRVDVYRGLTRTEAAWVEDEPEAADGDAPRTVTDPVCGMTVVVGEEAGRAADGGVLYYFCARSCREEFLAEPERFLKGERIAMADSTSDKVRDPVCGMMVTVGEEAARETHDGTTYYFCATSCAAAFRADPERFLHGTALPDEPRTAVDPVCGMTVMRESAAARLDWEGATYFFCGAGCLQKFVANPDSYKSSAS
jgi:YHS domain-containing protein/soluble P-type ATPase